MKIIERRTPAYDAWMDSGALPGTSADTTDDVGYIVALKQTEMNALQAAYGNHDWDYKNPEEFDLFRLIMKISGLPRRPGSEPRPE
tara:strand:- start:3152 stop:3409 length:258 start_codon:yes stop_codon:yes gene_type:complete